MSRRASTCFSDEQRRRIEQAVADAESRTAAEIVPAVAAASGRYDRAEDIAGLWLGLIAMLLTWLWLPRGAPEPGSWGGRAPWMDGLLLVAGMILGFLAGAVLASNLWTLRRLFTPKRQMRDEVAAAARRAFFDARVHHTTGRTGLLIYVSLYEHVAAVLADQVVTEKLGQPALDELCARLTANLRRDGDVTTALVAVIGDAGKRLAATLPAAPDDRDEIAASLVTLD